MHRTKIKIQTAIFLTAICVAMGSCKKFLDERPIASLAVPTSLKDFQALLDHFQTMHHADVAAGEMSSTDYYVTEQDWLTQSENDRRMYLWENDHVFPEAPPNDWSNAYRAIYRANTVINGMIDTEPDLHEDPIEWHDVIGQAYFYRARAFLQATTLWTLAYDEKSADELLGIPIRLSTDFNEKSFRASLGETYTQIIDDLENAVKRLKRRDERIYRPDKAAAYALLSRTHLLMGSYDLAGNYADSCLQIQNSLLNYHELSSINDLQPQQNPEIIFYAHIYASSRLLLSPWMKVSDELYRHYGISDLRKTLFFQEVSINDSIDHVLFAGNYGENPLILFSGLTTPEVLLTRAECFVRKGDLEAGMEDIQLLWKNRMSVIPDDFPAYDQDRLLEVILEERRRELVFRGTRWGDIKRLNNSGLNIVLEREMGSEVFRLLPNSARFALPIPEQIVAIGGITQNPY